MTMGFQTRTFLLSFIPFALLLTGSFWMVQRLVQTTVREEIRTSVRQNHIAIGRVRAKTGLQNNRFLKIAGENSSLKAGMLLLLLERQTADARLTVEDQLRELCQRMDFDFLLVSSPNGRPVAGVSRANDRFAPMDLSRLPAIDNGLAIMDGSAYQIASVAIDQADDNLGSLSVGERFDLSELSTPAVLLRDGEILLSSVPDVHPSELQLALGQCQASRECEMNLHGATYISLPMPGFSPGVTPGAKPGANYVLRSVQNEDSATGPVRAVLRSAFITVLIVAVLVSVIISLASSRSIVKPIVTVISHLRATESTGLLPEFNTVLSPIREIRDLANSFNLAASSIRDARRSLQKAYIESVGSLANALDARDCYTAGHSHRVSDLSCATARAMELNEEQVERIRVGALLHDIGKIGIPDAVLNKPGKLTESEYDRVKQHPGIGKRILEGVNGFAPYLDAVEFHHENWNGSGYPRGQAGEQTPMDARIIHVSDAYDAMTSDRPYRLGMTHQAAIDNLIACAGTMFDPRIVSAFTAVVPLPDTSVPMTQVPLTPASEYELSQCL
jgi:HD-GYP domain-containing protein (c-di-GMP phosphodiesterase class II)